LRINEDKRHSSEIEKIINRNENMGQKLSTVEVSNNMTNIHINYIQTQQNKIDTFYTNLINNSMPLIHEKILNFENFISVSRTEKNLFIEIIIPKITETFSTIIDSKIVNIDNNVAILKSEVDLIKIDYKKIDFSYNISRINENLIENEKRIVELFRSNQVSVYFMFLYLYIYALYVYIYMHLYICIYINTNLHICTCMYEYTSI
jgi:hypothetical protein